MTHWRTGWTFITHWSAGVWLLTGTELIAALVDRTEEPELGAAVALWSVRGVTVRRNSLMDNSLCLDTKPSIDTKRFRRTDGGRERALR